MRVHKACLLLTTQLPRKVASAAKSPVLNMLPFSVLPRYRESSPRYMRARALQVGRQFRIALLSPECRKMQQYPCSTARCRLWLLLHALVVMSFVRIIPPFGGVWHHLMAQLKYYSAGFFSIRCILPMRDIWILLKRRWSNFEPPWTKSAPRHPATTSRSLETCSLFL